MPARNCSSSHERNRLPGIAHPLESPAPALHVEICPLYQSIFRKERAGDHIDDNIHCPIKKHDNQPIRMLSLSFTWHPSSSSLNCYSAGAGDSGWCLHTHTYHNAVVAMLIIEDFLLHPHHQLSTLQSINCESQSTKGYTTLTPATCQSACHYNHSFLPGRHPFVNHQAYLK